MALIPARLSLPFSGPIDVTTVTSETVFLVNLGSTLPRGYCDSQVVGINQMVWDPATSMLHMESDELLDATHPLCADRDSLLQDAVGDPVETSEAFARFRHDLNYGQTKTCLKAYRKALLDALASSRARWRAAGDIVVASVFTTQSTTAVLEKIRDQLKAATPQPADFNLAEDGSRTVFTRSTVAEITFDQQTAPILPSPV